PGFPARVPAEQLFLDVPEAIEESMRVAESCRLDLCDAPPVFPTLPVPQGETKDSFLSRVCHERLKAGRNLGLWSGEEYSDRLRKELAVIQELRFSDYFRVVGEIATFAREQRIGLAGRGSAVGSLVAHLL